MVVERSDVRESSESIRIIHLHLFYLHPLLFSLISQVYVLSFG